MGITPSLKWTTKHHFEDPLLKVLSKDKWVEPIAIVIYGSSDLNKEKIFASERTAQVVKAINPDGVILELDGFGNNHVEWVNCVNEIGKAKIPMVGVSYKEPNEFVVKTKYLKENYVDIDAAFLDYESCVVGQNTITQSKAEEVLKKIKLEIIKKEV